MPLRVLLITSTSAIGGAEQMVLQLLEHADRERVCYEVASVGGTGELIEAAGCRGVVASDLGIRRLASPLNWRRMHGLLAGRRPDVVQVSGLRAELLARPVARALGVPYIAWVHSIDPWRKAQHVALDRLTAGCVTRWVSVCEAARAMRVQRERVPAERIQVIYNGIAKEDPPGEGERAEARARFGLTEGVTVLAAVGNLREAKGYPDLIEALVRLREGGKRVVCLCAGRDDSQGRIPELARALGAGDLIRFLGFVEQPRTLLAAADAVVISSHWEGCPINLIEAMRARKPIVATRVGGIPEMIEDGTSGVLVPARDPEALAAGIAKILGDPAAARRMAAAAEQRFARQFTAERMSAEMLKVYQSIAR